MQDEISDDRHARDHLFSAVYEELRRLAAGVKRTDGSLTLNPTALVNELWIKLVKDKFVVFESELHFKRVAARAMRQILVDASRRRRAQKRSWGLAASPDLLDATVAGELTCGTDLLALDTALDDLAAINQRHASIVELRFFGGLSVVETAALLGVSEATIMRDWRMARAWLGQSLRGVE